MSKQFKNKPLAVAVGAADEAADAAQGGSGSAGAFTLLGLLSAIGLRRRIKRR